MWMGNLTPSMGDLTPSSIGDLSPSCCGEDLTPSAISGEDLNPSAISGEDLTPSAISGDLTPSLQLELSPPGVVGSPGRQEECLGVIKLLTRQLKHLTHFIKKISFSVQRCDWMFAYL